MTPEQQKAIDAYQRMIEGAARGGSGASGEAKRRSPEHYAAVTLAASITRARNRGLDLYEATDRAGEFLTRAMGANVAEARAKAVEKTGLKPREIYLRRLS
jgi:hydroxymethylpyrimidine/phosphomethylpyrimidine kinase